jgi:hypothetical protein
VYEKRVLSPRFCATFLFSSHFFKLCYDKNRTTNKEKTLLLFTAKNMKVIHTYSFMKKLLKKVTTPPTPYELWRWRARLVLPKMLMRVLLVSMGPAGFALFVGSGIPASISPLLRG